MPFPISTRIIYKKNPIVEVICQLRFPQILQIQSESPVQFQERIRASYPEYRQSVSIRFPNQFLQQLPPLVQEAISQHNPNTHEFRNASMGSMITLAPDFLALTVDQYRGWEDFLSGFHRPLEALVEIYRPSYFSRIGLRYQNILRRSHFGFDTDYAWDQLLNPSLLAVVGDPNVGNDVRESISQTVLDHPKGLVKIHHGLVKFGSEEFCFLIDTDIYLERRIEIEHGLQQLDDFHELARHIFEWAITPKLRTSMELD